MKKTYYFADAQILHQRIHTDPADTNDYEPYWYVHDRLGNVRLVADYNDVTDTVDTRNVYTYTPFGKFYEGQITETIDNPWKFTGQYFDS